MSADRDPRFPPADEPDDDLEEEEETPRSIFSTTWFRVVLVVLVIGVVGAVAVPYVLDVVNPPETPAPRTVAAPPSPSVAPPSSGASATKPSTPAPSTSTSATPSVGAGSSKAVESPATAKAPAAVAEAPKADVKPAPEKASAEKPAAKAAAALEKTPAEKPAAKPAAKAATARAAAPAKSTEGGDYFVQVGAFRDPATAKRVAARLREQNYPVDESVKRIGDAPVPAAAPRPTGRASASAPDRYDVIVSGGSSEEINTRLAAKGLASEPAGDGVRIRPSLPLRDAVALSKDLGSEGFKVQVRRGAGANAQAAPSTAPAPAPASDAGSQTLYRVRVGGYPDRATAQTVLKELQEKGFQPFLAKGRE